MTRPPRPASISTRQRGWRLLVKRTVDVGVAGAGLLATAPILAVSVAAVRMTMGAPAIFRQTRPGRGERPFDVFKLRTMTNERGSDGELLPDSRRLNRLGRFLRATSLDELPQLWNVVRGDMSLVGPRPLLVDYLARYSPEQHRRHDVLPGITGWSAVNGRNSIDWAEKLSLDVWYVDNWSLRLDARILLKTATQLVRPTGIVHEGSATMPPFLGVLEGTEEGRAAAAVAPSR